MGIDFSIIIPSYNQGRFIETCLQSIVDQKGSSVQIVVVDNNSSDETRAVLNKFEKFIDKLIIEPDNGQTEALNKGFRHARGEIVNWLCCDDALVPNALEMVKAAFKNNPSCEVVAGWARVYSSSKATPLIRTAKPSKRISEMLAFPRIVQPATFWRFSVFQNLCPLDERLNFVMDLDLWLRYLCKNGIERIAYIDALLCSIEEHTECKSLAHRSLFPDEISFVRSNVLRSFTDESEVFRALSHSHLDVSVLKGEIQDLLFGLEVTSSLRNCDFKKVMTLVSNPTHVYLLLRHLLLIRSRIIKSYQ